MKIIIDVRNTGNNDTALRVFIFAFWQDTAISQPDHAFVFMADKKTTLQLPANTQIQYLKMTRIRWLDRLRIKKIISRTGADKLVTIQGAGFCINNHFFSKKHAKELVMQDKRAVFMGVEMDQPATQPPVTFIQPALRDVITTLSWAEAESIKTQYTGGRSFFLFTGDIAAKHRLIELLQAFSIFKKWQQSNMQLVIAGSVTGWTGMFEEKLSAYKYKQDVVLLKNINSAVLAKLVAASYAMLYPVASDVFPLALLWAVQSNKAIIATDNRMNRQLTAHAAWVADNDTAAGFSKAMIQLYKDEKQQQMLVQQTQEQSKQFSRQQMLATAWQCIEK